MAFQVEVRRYPANRHGEYHVSLRCNDSAETTAVHTLFTTDDQALALDLAAAAQAQGVGAEPDVDLAPVDLNTYMVRDTPHRDRRRGVTR